MTERPAVTDDTTSTANRRPALLTGITRTVVLLAFTSLFADISSEMLYLVLPLFLTEVLDTPATVVGLVKGIGGACRYGIQGVAGWLGDRLGRQKWLAAAGYAVSAADNSYPDTNTANQASPVSLNGLAFRFWRRLARLCLRLRPLAEAEASTRCYDRRV